MRIFVHFVAGIVVLCAALLTNTPAAEACGGLFQEASGPAFLQEAEGIVFVAGSDGTVTALVHIAHQRSAGSFAWLLPVPGTPEVGLSTRRTFEELAGQTAPRFSVDMNNCDNNVAGNSTANNTGGGGVQVLDEGAVGPYLYETITVTGAGDANGEVARVWLQDNGYWVDDEATALLGSYLDAGMNIIAFQLQSGASSSDIRPVSLRMQADDIMLPLRLASVGAVEDTQLRIWVFGEANAVTTNVPDVELNECIFTWNNEGGYEPVDNYDDVLRAAVDEAGGRAFVTEFAGNRDLRGIVYSGEMRRAWLDAQSPTLTDLDLVNQLASSFVDADGLHQALREASVVVDFACVERNSPSEDLNNTNGGCSPSECDCVLSLPADFDRQILLDAVERLVIEPARLTQELLDSRPVLTAFHTRMSPTEMDVDPRFAFNDARPSVSGAARAVYTNFCDGAGRSEGPQHWELPGGCEVWTEGQAWPLSTPDLPAAARIVQYGTNGATEVLQDNTGRIQEAVDAHNARVNPGSAEQGGGCCRVVGGARPRAWPWLTGLALVLVGGWRQKRRTTNSRSWS